MPDVDPVLPLIREALMKANASRVSEATGISNAHLSNIKAGKQTKLGVVTARKLCDYFKIPMASEQLASYVPKSIVAGGAGPTLNEIKLTIKETRHLDPDAKTAIRHILAGRYSQAAHLLLDMIADEAGVDPLKSVTGRD